jgi:hypothetical protein
MISKTSLEDTETVTRMIVEGMQMVTIITTQVCILMATAAHTIIASCIVVVRLITTE